MQQKGFSLLELSIALAILGGILSGVYLSQSSSREFNNQKENQAFMERIQNAFYTFVQVNGFLPCPDTDNDGRENRNLSLSGELRQCTLTYGQVPYLDLGMKNTDEWRGRLHYAVNQDADDTNLIIDDTQSASYFNRDDTAAPVPSFDLNTPPIGVLGGPQSGNGNYIICRESSNSCDGSTANSNIIEHSAIAVVVSFGTAGGSARSAIEQENTDNDAYFWQAQRSISSGQEFDDQLFWLTGYDLKYAIIRSEKGLPDLP